MMSLTILRQAGITDNSSKDDGTHADSKRLKALIKGQAKQMFARFFFITFVNSCHQEPGTLYGLMPRL